MILVGAEELIDTVVEGRESESTEIRALAREAKISFNGFHKESPYRGHYDFYFDNYDDAHAFGAYVRKMKVPYNVQYQKMHTGKVHVQLVVWR